MVTVASTMPFAPGRKMAFTKRNAVKTVENTHNASSQPPLAALGIGDDNVFVACRNSTLPFQIRVSSVSVSIAALLHAIDDFPQRPVHESPRPQVRKETTHYLPQHSSLQLTCI